MNKDEFDPSRTTTNLAKKIARLNEACAFWWKEVRTGRWYAELPVGDGVHATFIDAPSSAALLHKIEAARRA